MTLFNILAIVVWVASLIFSLFIVARNKKVADFRRQIIEEDYHDTMRNVDNGIFENVDNYSKLPSYGKMIFSFKPLTKDHWL